MTQQYRNSNLIFKNENLFIRTFILEYPIFMQIYINLPIAIGIASSVSTAPS